MNATLTEQALGLPAHERLELLEQLWDSLSRNEDAIGLTDAQRRELDARLDDLEANPTGGRPWSEVRADLESLRRP